MNYSKHRLYPEDINDVRRMIVEDRIVVECSTLDERRDVLKILSDEGFGINPPSRTYLDPKYTDFSYPNPGADPYDDRESDAFIVCYRNILEERNWVSYADFMAVYEPDEPMETPDEEEFSSALADLLGM